MVKIRDNIWLVNERDGRNIRLIKKNGITAVLNVAFDVPGQVFDPREIDFVKIGLGDYNKNKEYLKRLAVDTLKNMLYNGEKVLVHCAVGASRSVWVICQAISELERKHINDVLEEVQKSSIRAIRGPLFDFPAR